MRGKVNKLPGINIPSGITPAYAGKRLKILCHVKTSQDHPRLCGEKFLLALWKIFWTGSPPPMRGKATIRPTGFKLMRITPAYAGKSVCEISCIL